MCGIVGAFRLDGRPVDEGSLLAARDRLLSRGPDDSGLFVDGPIGLGHRRLSIIDLSPAGRMPMSTESGSVCGVFNGEIYNFAGLRSELEARGHRFRSHTDSEVIIHAYEEWGTASFARYEGMFALALWDHRAHRLVLARDITGEKPLYYYFREGRAALFASTLKALLQFPEVSRDLDEEALRLYMELGFVPAPRSILEHVFKVEPGSFVTIERGRAPLAKRYWSLENVIAQQPEHRVSLDQATDELQALLRDAVTSRLVADVPLGAFLSGGVDSSLVVAMMAEARSAVRTFTIGFREHAFDESEYAHRVAKHLGVENTTMVLSATDVLRELPAVTEAIDEPMADYSALPTLAVARLARRHVTVALTGDGADEAFAGYRYYGGTQVFETVARFVPRALRAGVAARASWVPYPRLQRALQRTSVEDAAAYFSRCGFYRGATANTIPRILVPISGRRTAEDEIARYVRAHDHIRPTEAGLLWDATHTLPDAWLAKVDRTTMAVSLESRAPFLDRRVLEYAFRLPLQHRVRGTQKKIILRRILARYLPAELIERPKQGFTAPMRMWFANELRAELHDRLAPTRVERFGIFNARVVAELLTEQDEGKTDHTQLLWALFHLDRWREAHLTT